MKLALIVLDGAGIGAMPDAAEYGDEGTNTIANTALAVGGLSLPNMARLGLGNLSEIPGVPPCPDCRAAFGVMLELSKGKDTTTGHWEMAGIITERPFPVYPDGFPDDLIHRFEAAIGRETLGNYPASGTEIIESLGQEHMRAGKPIVYTSADSVFQVAAHEDIIPIEELYLICRTARNLLTGEYNVARVIARPFVGQPGSFRRTERRQDFSIPPPSPTILDSLSEAGIEVTGVGKIGDVFTGRGISRSIHTSGNLDGIRQTIEAVQTSSEGLIWANLVDFDTLYGHRNDPRGFAASLQEFDAHLPEIMEVMGAGDCLIITADHGVDPTTPGTDHTREMVPLLVWRPGMRHRVDLGRRKTFADIAATVSELFGLDPRPIGTSFAADILSA